MDQYSVIHNPGTSRFEIVLEDGRLAYLEYEDTGLRLNFAHTYVPKEFEGRGIAATLVKSGLEYAQKIHKQVIPSCPYVEAYLKRHPEYGDLVE